MLQISDAQASQFRRATHPWPCKEAVAPFGRLGTPPKKSTSDVVDAFDGLRREADRQGHMCGNGRQGALDDDLDKAKLIINLIGFTRFVMINKKFTAD